MSSKALPSAWALAEIDALASLSLGKMLDQKAQTGDHPTSYLKNINVRWFAFDLSELGTMDIRPEELERVTVLDGDLVVCEGGEPGRCAVWKGEPVAIQKALHRVRPDAGIHPAYLAYALSWWSRRRDFGNFTTGTTIKHLPQEKLRRMPVPVPPAAEQQRIVDELERRFSHLDQAVTGLRSALRMVASLRDATLWAAVLPGSGVHHPTGGLLLLPDGWTWSTLGQVADVVGGVTKDSKRQSDPLFVEVPYLRVANVQRGYLDLGEVTTIRVHPDKAKALALVPGDILMNEGGDRDKLGRGWVWEGQVADCIHQNHVFRARLHEPRLAPKFVSWLGNSFGRRWFESAGKQTTNLASINKKTLEAFPVPLPPLGAVHRIVAETERRLSLIDAAERTIEDNLRKAEQLRRSLLHAAFAGKLVPQDPADEPASELLVRIKAQRDAELATKKKAVPAPRPRRKKELSA